MGRLINHLILLGPLFVIGAVSLAELVVAVVSTAYGWWFVFFVSMLLLLLFLQMHAAERNSEASALLEVVDRQNLALADALRLVDLLRSMAAKQRKKSMCIESAKASLWRGSRSTGDLSNCSRVSSSGGLVQ